MFCRSCNDRFYLIQYRKLCVFFTKKKNNQMRRDVRAKHEPKSVYLLLAVLNWTGKKKRKERENNIVMCVSKILSQN